MEGNTAALLYGVCTAFAVVAILYVLNCIMEWREKRTKPFMRVIKKGKIPTKRVECLHCHSIVEYNRMAMGCTHLQPENYWYVTCPVCGLTIKIEEWEGGEE